VGCTENTASDRSSIVVCITVATLMWHLLCPNLVKDVSSGKIILAFSGHATISWFPLDILLDMLAKGIITITAPPQKHATIS
jgi:hypothetical protein